jgi:hydrogenase maturation protease
MTRRVDSKQTTKYRKQKTLILGIGNILRKDDGFGIHVIRELEKLKLPEGVILLDGGTAGFDIITYLKGVKRLIIIDSLLIDGNPGEIKLLSHDDLSPINSYCISGHEGKLLLEMLNVAHLLWGKIETIIVGVIPEDYASYEIGLSTSVRKAIPEVVRFVRKQVR